MATAQTLSVQFPLWTITAPTFQMKGVLSSTSGVDVLGVIFRDKALAQAFIQADSRMKGSVIRSLVDPWHLVGFLRLLDKAGFTHVLLDPPAANPAFSTPAGGDSVSNMLSQIEQSLI